MKQKNTTTGLIDKEAVVSSLQGELKGRNVNALPRLRAVFVNVGIGDIRNDKAKVEALVKDLQIITGQKPAPTRARKSVSGFFLRQGEVVGYKVTLRGRRMYDFVTRLMAVVLPRTRDFHGLSRKAFDSSGNYTLGIRDHTVFPEIYPDEVKVNFGLEVTLVTTARDAQTCEILLRTLGFPMTKD